MPGCRSRLFEKCGCRAASNRPPTTSLEVFMKKIGPFLFLVVLVALVVYEFASALDREPVVTYGIDTDEIIARQK